MDAEGHAIMAEINKAQLDKKAEHELKEDMNVHKEHSKNALKKKEEKMAEMKETLLHEDEIDHAWHANMKGNEDRAKEIALNKDVNLHEERMEQTAHRCEELAAKKHADAEQLARSEEEHRKNVALRRAAANSPH
uniref:Uncharacterized protein n=1 Tax=Plectus sambesii TaxID=2011161 RepID=A0A914XHF1_9BILA